MSTLLVGAFLGIGATQAPGIAAAASPTPGPNPALPDVCGLTIALDFDLSLSITAPQLVQMKDAATRLVTALAGTTTEIGVYTFASYAPATNASGGTAPAGNLSLPATSLADPANVAQVEDHIAGITKLTTSSAGYTNWDRGLAQIGAQQPHYDAVLLITDGDPTAYGNNVHGSTQQNLDAAVDSANALKADGTRVVAVGVSNTTGASVNRLQAISGPTPDSDYFITNFQALVDTLVGIATRSCLGTLTVVKEVVQPDGTLATAPGWTFDATSTAGTVTPESGRTGDAGGVEFDLPGSGTVTVSETQQGGYQLVAQDGANASCRSTDSANGTVVLPVTDAGDHGFTVTVASQQIVTCLVVNRLIPAHLTLVKKVDNSSGGTADADEWTLTAAGPTRISGPTGSEDVTSAPVTPGSYGLSEDGPGDYTASAWSCTGASGVTVGPAGSGTATVVLDPDANATCTVTNTSSPPTPPPAVVQLSQSKVVDASTAKVGDVLTYTMTVANQSATTAAPDVTAEEVLPKDVAFVSSTASQGSYDPSTDLWEVGTIKPLAKATLAIKAEVEPAAAGSDLVDAFSVTPPPGSPPPVVEDPCSDAQYPDPQWSCASTSVPGDAQIVQDKVVDLGMAEPDNTLTYVMSAANTGSSAVGGVTATESLPSGVTFVSASASQGSYDPSTGTWTIGTLEPGTAATLTVRARVDQSAVNSTLTDRFQVTPPAGSSPPTVLDPCGDDPDQSCAFTQVPGLVQLRQAKTVSPTTAKPGQTVTYHLTVANVGSGYATDVAATDLMPAGITFVSADTQGVGTYNANTDIWTIPYLPPGASVTMLLTATANVDAAGTTTVNGLVVTPPPGSAANEVTDPCSANPAHSCALLEVGPAHLASTGADLAWPLGAALAALLGGAALVLSAGHRRRRPAGDGRRT